MLPSTLLVLASMALSAVVAHPQPQPVPALARRDDWDPCLPHSVAKTLVNAFASLLTNFNNATAVKYLAPTFSDTSDSINSLAGIPLGSVTFPSRAAFIAGQSQQPPIGFTVLSIDAVTCNVVAFRWVAQVGSKAQEVKGINIFYAGVKPSGTRENDDADDDNNWWILKNYSEFNSLAWWVDIGGGLTPPPHRKV